MKRCAFAAVLWLVAVWSAVGQVLINEIHYDPDPKTELIEFIELHNAGASSVNVGGWRFTQGVDYTIPAQTSIPGGGFLVIAQDPVALNAKFGVTALGPWSGLLSNDGEPLQLRDASGNRIDTLDYQRGFPWPTCPDGASMELINPLLDNDLGGSWRSSGNPPGLTTPTYIASGETGWRFFKGRQEPSSPSDAWRGLDFVETADWQTGQASFGYGDDDDNTTLSDMRYSYTTVYLRKTFLVDPGTMPSAALLRVYADDGAIVWINGHELWRPHVTAGFKAYNATCSNHEAEWEEFTVVNASSVLVEGTNIIAVHAINQAASSSDFSIDIELKDVPSGGSDLASPGLPNRVSASNAPPAIRQVRHTPEAPGPGQTVVITAKVTDPQGVQEVMLEYKSMAPGSYVRAMDAAYATGWTTQSMRDDGVGDDAAADDNVYSAAIQAGDNLNRSLVRYRIVVTDGTGLSQRVPYEDDLRRNFAYFVYGGVPAWTAADQPGITSNTTFPTNVMAGTLPVYHLLAQKDDVERCQYNQSYIGTRFYGTIVYDGRVYDHIQFKIRGEHSTYASGKNKWRFYFNRGDDFQARDNYGKKYGTKFRRMNFNGCCSPWVPANRGMAGLDEAVSYGVHRLAGVLSPKTHFVHFRVIDDVNEAPAGAQYAGDLWGLYIAIEHIDGRFLDERDLPDGNIYKIVTSNGEKRNQGRTQSEDSSDWDTFRNATSTSSPVSWWRANFDLASYYTFRGINRVVSNVDLRDGDNFGMYHHVDGHWYVIPQDFDMMLVPVTHWPGTVEMKDCLAQSEIANEFRNRCRELMDLLLRDASPAGGQAVQFMHDLGQWVNPAGEPLTFADVDRFMWNYHPRTSLSQRGQFYVTPNSGSLLGGSWTRTLVSPDYEGFVQYIADFMTDTDPDGFYVGDGDQRGYGFNYIEQEAQDNDIPYTPTVSYTGAAGYPVDGLRFDSSSFSDPQGNGSFGAIKWRIAEVRNSSTPGYEAGERWRYEINALWESEEVPAPDLVSAIPPVDLAAGRVYRARVRHMDNTGRWSHWSQPAEFVAGLATGATALASLLISEIHYHPLDFEDYQFVEFHNTGISALNLSGVELDGGVEFVFPADTVLGPNAYIVVVEDIMAFDERYRDPASPFYSPGIVVAGQWTQSLSTDGETLRVEAPGETVLFSVKYADGGDWPGRAAGHGSSIELIDLSAVPATQPGKDVYLDDGLHWRPSPELHGNPGRAGSVGDLLLINEVLAHSDAAPGLDWIELINMGTDTVSAVDIYVSDSWTNLANYPLTISIPPGEFVVLDELELGFAFSELGDEAIVTRINPGGTVTFLDAVDFGASVRDVTFGRHVRSDGETDFTALMLPTPGSANAYPLVGPVVVSEIMYCPTGGVEYIELANLLDEPIALFDPAHPTNTWRFTSGIEIVFPTNTLIPTGLTLLVTTANAAAFRTIYSVDSSTEVISPWDGTLDNDGETVLLCRPYDPEATGVVPYVLAEKIAYRPTEPWPVQAAPGGYSLERVPLYAYGNDPASWRPSETFRGTPGHAFRHGVHMQIGIHAAEGERVKAIWATIPGERYAIDYCDSLMNAAWYPLQTLVAQEPLTEIVDDAASPTRRFYRIRWLR